MDQWYGRKTKHNNNKVLICCQMFEEFWEDKCCFTFTKCKYKTSCAPRVSEFFIQPLIQYRIGGQLQSQDQKWTHIWVSFFFFKFSVWFWLESYMLTGRISSSDRNKWLRCPYAFSYHITGCRILPRSSQGSHLKILPNVLHCTTSLWTFLTSKWQTCSY